MTLRLTLLFLLFVLPAPLRADDLEVVVTGVDGVVSENVRAYVAPFRIAGTGRMNARRMERLRTDAVTNATRALRPYGYYQARVHAGLSRVGEAVWRLQVEIDPGPPVIVAAARVELSGPGADLPELAAWRDGWPLKPGKRLDQPTWESEKQRALAIAADRGFLLADYTRHDIAVDLEANQARLDLALDTGEQAVMGEIRFHQEAVRPHVVDKLPRFRAGDPYDAWIMERFRLDLWQAGYFNSIEIVEDRHLGDSPPRVDLDVNLETRPPNTYQSTVGFGSDTGPRLQFGWDRHLVSPRGDSFSLATGWQDHNNEFFVRGTYRIPRYVRSRQAWLAEGLMKRETEDFKVSRDLGSELIDLGNVDINDYSLRLGRLKIYDRSSGFRQLFETWYVQYLDEQLDFRLSDGVIPYGAEPGSGRLESSLARSSRTYALGVDYEMPYTRGEGFETVGQHHRAWAFLSNDAWGSDRDFSQVYLSGRWTMRAGEDWKILLRGEAGYSHSDIDKVEIDDNGQPLQLSVTRLPNLYRFKAGGSSSVRGYGFESLSNNHIGSNNIVTASAEAEYRLLENWSLAAFFDAGNAFNDWDDMELKKGWGLGVRWYTFAGTMRVDLAQGLDLPGDPWRIHFTIGASVL